jgi:hypothetical protein
LRSQDSENMISLVLAGAAYAAVTLGAIEAQAKCGNLIKSISFEGCVA